MMRELNTETPKQDSRRRVPRVVLVAPRSSDGILKTYPGHFVLLRATTCRDLESLLLGHAVDCVILDCRLAVPDADILHVVRHDPVVEFLAVGRPADRRSLPNPLRAHAVPWPIDREAFYRLVTAMAKKAGTERRLRRMRQTLDAVEAEAHLGRRLAQTLHEINNPLDGVMRYLRLLRGEQDPARSTAFLDDAETGLVRIAEVLHGLHQEARQTALAVNLVDLAEVVRESVVMSGVITDAFAVQVDLEDPRLEVPSAIKGIMINLLKNSRAACGVRGNIRIRSALRGEELEIAVSDDGEGFGALFKEELFKPWFSTKGSEGLGLGLFQSRLQAERLGGRLEADSPGVGQGATFTIVLPRLATQRPLGLDSGGDVV